MTDRRPHEPGARANAETPFADERRPSRRLAWYRRLSPIPQAIVLIVVTAALTTALGLGALLAWFAWVDHEFEHGSYCSAEPADPLC